MELAKSYLRWARPPRDLVPVEVVVVVPDLTPERGGHGEESREEPDEGDVDGVRPGSWHEAVFSGKVPLAVLDEEVEGQEEGGEGEEEEEAVVEVAVADAVDVAELPRQTDDLRVQGEGHAQ